MSENKPNNSSEERSELSQSPPEDADLQQTSPGSYIEKVKPDEFGKHGGTLQFEIPTFPKEEPETSAPPKKRRRRKFRFPWQKKKKPRKKIRLTPKGWILVSLLLGFTLIGLYVFLNKPDAIDRLSLTYLDNLSKKDLAVELQDTFENTYPIRDYTIYGETLVLYRDGYEEKDYDDLYGKNVMLRNIETGEEISSTFSGGADAGINLGALQPGVYEVYVYDEYTPKRVYAGKAFEAPLFTTIRRDKEVTNVNIEANADYLGKFGIKLDKNYLFITVTDSLPKVKVTDVVIDPSGLVPYLNSTEVQEDYHSDLIDEAKASYQLAMAIQSYLQDAGLRVELTRDMTTANSYYGVSSRVGIGYTKQAKVFLALSMTETETDRPFILCSPYTIGGLANEMSYTLAQNGVELEPVSSLTRLNQGVGYDTLLTDDSYQYTRWTLYPQIRETGGKVTSAGTGENWTANEGFAKSYGMYGILFAYASTESTDSQQYYLDNQDAIARSISQAILTYFDIPVDSQEGEKS